MPLFLLSLVADPYAYKGKSRREVLESRHVQRQDCDQDKARRTKPRTAGGSSTRNGPPDEGSWRKVPCPLLRGEGAQLAACTIPTQSSHRPLQNRRYSQAQAH